jgi:hypothetical protein
MSRATVRTAIQNYLQNANVTYLSQVKPFPAKFTPEMEFYEGEDPMHRNGVVMYLFFEKSSERRIAFGGATNGRKEVEHSVILDCIFRSANPQSEDAGAENELFLDSLVQSIRANRNAGSPSVIFQWGEGSLNGGADIDITSYYPQSLRAAQSAVQIVSRVAVSVIEILEA